MSEYLETLWAASPHTLAKHDILAAYLKAWMPILARQYQNQKGSEVLFLDGFAGPGEYTTGEPGSPVVAMNVALQHAHSFPIPISFLFVEADQARYNNLLKVINGQQSRISQSQNVRLLSPKLADCNDVVKQLLKERANGTRPKGPILAFLDQFGYSDVPLTTVAAIMEQQSCETFSYMNWQFLNPYMTDPNKAAAITRAFGDESWKVCLELRGHKRAVTFVRLYADQLRRKANCRYVWHFAMCGEGDQLLSWLVFCSNNLRGLEEMKRAMWRVDDHGGFRFSDGADPNQLAFLKFVASDDAWLAKHLHTAFLGQSKTIEQIKEYVLTETPCYRFKECLADLERASKIRVTTLDASKRRQCDFSSESLQIEFVPPPPVQQSLFSLG